MTRACAAQSGASITALTTICRDKPPRICSNCNKEGHLAAYCIKASGGMARKTLEEACTIKATAGLEDFHVNC